MPEYPEVKIMSTYLNDIFKGQKVTHLTKCLKCKHKADLSILNGRLWDASAESRGREIMITFTNENEIHKLKINFAKIGQLFYDKIGDVRKELDEAEVLRIFIKDDPNHLYIYDRSRFSTYRWVSEWSNARGPDILRFYEEWIENIYVNRHRKEFNKEIFEEIIDQRYFNGIGTFLRAEILSRSQVSPFMKFSDLFKDEKLRTDFFETCYYVIERVGELGGLQFKLWKNPYSVNHRLLSNWSQCYSEKYFILDRAGRKFWFLVDRFEDYKEWQRNLDDNIEPSPINYRDGGEIKKIYMKIKLKK